MLRLLVPLVFVSLLLGSLFAAEPKWQKDWNRGLEEAVERKVPILIVIPNRRGSQGPIIFPKLLTNKQVLELCDKFVCFIADDARFPEIEKRIAAFYHKGKFGFYGQKLQFVFCKPDGEELEKYRLVGDVKRGQLTKTMMEVLKLYPEAVPKSEFEKCRRLRDLAEMFRKELIYNEAIKKYKELAERKVELEMVELAKDKEKELLDGLEKVIEEVKKMLTSGSEADKKEAARRLVRLKVGTKGLKQHRLVIELLKKAKEDDAVKGIAKGLTSLERALKKFIKAEELFCEGNLRKAYGEYKEIVRKYRQTGFVERAKERMEEIEALLAPKKEEEKKK